MIMKKKVLTFILKNTGGCPKEFGLNELECSDQRRDINCAMCWDHAIKDVEKIELEG